MKEIKDLRVAIVHDWAFKMTGGEKCLEVLAEMYPNADIYMLFGDSKALSASITSHKIFYSFLQKFPFIKRYHRYTYFLWPIAIESFNFNGYDIVISSSACAAKGIVTSLDTLHICYMHTPMRYAWDLTWDYFNPKNFSFWKRIVIPFFLTYLRIWDVASTSRIDKLIVNSNFVNRRVRKYYRRSADYVVFPPVYTGQFDNSKKRNSYYLSVAPFEPNKRGDLLIEVAKKTGINVKILGKGSKLKELQKLSKGYPNIEFFGFITDPEKYELFSKAHGLFFLGKEDFGIVPLEASAAGVPVIAYAAASVFDTVIDDITGIYFYKQDVDSVVEAMTKLDNKYKNGEWDTTKMREHAMKFDKSVYIEKVSTIVSDAYDEFWRQNDEICRGSLK